MEEYDGQKQETKEKKNGRKGSKEGNIGREPILKAFSKPYKNLII